MARACRPLIFLLAAASMIPVASAMSAEEPSPLPQVIRYVGRSGIRGQDGLNGSRGSSGMTGSMDPNHPRAGGRGWNGSRGGDGRNGSIGGNGPDLLVQVVLAGGPSVHLEIRIQDQSDSGAARRVEMDPARERLTISTEGGVGGAGGRGGQGGEGGSGGMGRPNGAQGSSGLRGLDGSRGMNGRGGAITVIVEPRALPYLGTIHFENPGGPKPVIREESAMDSGSTPAR